MSRAALLERYRALPLPTTKDESWRFTDPDGNSLMLHHRYAPYADGTTP